MPERILNWLDFGPTGANVASGSTVETDGVAVTLDFAEGEAGASLHPFSLEQFVGEDEPFSADHALKIFGGGSTDGVMTTSTTTLSFASASEEFGDRVGNMLFRINDVDTGQGDQDYVDIVTVRAFDADGNELPVDLTGGSQVIVSGQTATGNDIDDPSVTLPSDPSKSVLVSIPGPLARVEIELANGGPDQQAVWLTELKYDITLPNGPVPCFTPGTMIATPRGERRVEDLQVGDRVITRDNGLQEIRWVGRRTLNARELRANPNLSPVLIRAGALGHGLPERDLLVSPQHRILMNSERAALYFDEREVLAAARHLTDMEGIDVVTCDTITYIHILFDQHEVVLSNGSWTESFQPGAQVLDGMGDAQRDEIYALFPELREKEGLETYQAARRSLRKHEARLLAAK